MLCKPTPSIIQSTISVPSKTKIQPPMRRKRGRRPPPESDRRSTELKASANKRLCSSIVIFFIVSVAIFAYLYYPMPKTDPHASIPYLNKDVTYQQILTEHATLSDNASTRRFPNPVLAYVTPWNSKGYEIAKDFNSKFTHISPVWYDLKRYQFCILGYMCSDPLTAVDAHPTDVYSSLNSLTK